VLFIAPLWIWQNEISALFASILPNDVGMQIALFHTLFNIITTMILLPFSHYVVKLACLIIPEKKGSIEEKFRFAYIDDRLLNTPAIAVSNTKNEIIRMSEFSKENINLSLNMLINDEIDNSEQIRETETVINHLNKSITAYLTKLMSKDLTDEDDKKVGSYYHVVSDIERVGDYAENIMEYAQRLRKEELSFSDDAKKELSDMLSLVNRLYEVSIRAFDLRNVDALPEVDELEEEIDVLSAELETRHIDRVKEGLCSAQVGSIFLQTVSNLERVGDHITNVSFSIRHYRHSRKADKTQQEIK